MLKPRTTQLFWKLLQENILKHINHIKVCKGHGGDSESERTLVKFTKMLPSSKANCTNQWELAITFSRMSENTKHECWEHPWSDTIAFHKSLIYNPLLYKTFHRYESAAPSIQPGTWGTKHARNNYPAIKEGICEFNSSCINPKFISSFFNEKH